VRHFLQYWRTYNPDADFGKTLNYAASAQFGRLRQNDILWIVALRERRLTLLGRLVVGKVVPKEQALIELGSHIYDAPLHAIAKPRTEIISIEADIQALASLLRFDSPQDRLSLVEPEHTGGKQLQALRELRAGSAALLRTVLESQSGSEAGVGEDTAVPINPKWSRDELILALDLYFRHPPSKISQNHPAVMELSEVLNKLGTRLGRVQNEKFRNPNGVYMKLCNFLRFDPEYHGTGLRAGSKLEEEVWKQFSTKRAELRAIAQAIIEAAKDEAPSLATLGDEEEELEFAEGAILYRTHLSRERNSELVRKAKERAKARSGRLICDVCGFDFHAVYGEVGEGYIECHHTVPVSDLMPGHKTRLEDIALLCANCHRMVHRRRPWLRMEELRDLLRQGHL